MLKPAMINHVIMEDMGMGMGMLVTLLIGIVMVKLLIRLFPFMFRTGLFIMKGVAIVAGIVLVISILFSMGFS